MTEFPGGQYPQSEPQTGPVPGQYGPPQPGLPAAPPPARRPHLRWAVLGGIVGLVIGALGVGLPWLLGSGGGGFGGGGSGAGMSAPANIGNFEQIEPAMIALGGQGQRNADATRSENQKSSQLLSQAYGGAAAVVQEYATVGVADMMTLNAVRAQSPLPYVQYEDAARLGLAVAPDQLVQVGQVYCVLDNQPTVAGQTPSSDSVQITYCQRTGPGLTVQIRMGGSADLGHHPSDAAGLVNAAWSALS